MLQAVDGGSTSAHPFIFVGASQTNRVTGDGAFIPVVNITCQSAQFGVQFTFTILKSTWDAGDAPTREEEHAVWVDNVCAYPHVIGFHTEPDQAPDQVVYNYAVILVGPEGATSGVEVTRRMDQLGAPATFQMIDQTWQKMHDAGAS